MIVALSVTACKKKPSENPIDDLPPITQEGKNTFGCLINGKLFLPGKKVGGLANILSCNYGHDPVFNYSFHLSAYNDRTQPYRSVYFNSKNKPLSVGEHDLGSTDIDSEISVQYVEWPYGKDAKTYKIDPAEKGKLKITKLDLANRIITGIFSFNATNQFGEKVEVREGRFDMHH